MTEYTSLAARVDAIEDRLDRIAQVQERHSDTLAAIIKTMDERFDAVDRRFAAMDKRLDGMDRRLDSMEKRFDTRFSNIELLLVDIAQAVKKGPSPQSNA